MNKVQNQDNNISDFYEIFYSGVKKEDLEKAFINQHKKYFDELTPDSKVCDSSCCGSGIQVTIL